MSLSSVSSFSWSGFALAVKCQIESLVETSPELGSVPDPCSSLSKGFGIRQYEARGPPVCVEQHEASLVICVSSCLS